MQVFLYVCKMIKEINTHRLWEISRLIYQEEDDTGIFNYPYDFYEDFLNRYSFKYDSECNEICYYVDNPIPYEDWLRDEEYNYIPVSIYEASDNVVKKWAEDKILKSKEDQKTQKEQEIHKLEQRLKYLKDGI